MPAEIKDLIKDLIAHKYEEEWFEFKVNWFEPKILGEYISALSNAAALTGRKYAYLIWGIDDKTHKVVGTDFDYHRNVKNEPLPHFLARQMNPDIAFQFLETTFQEKKARDSYNSGSKKKLRQLLIKQGFCVSDQAKSI